MKPGEKIDAERTFDRRRRRGRPRKGRHYRQFHGRGRRRLVRRAGHRRFLGALVRALQAARADPRKDRARHQRRRPDGQAQYRREPRDRAADAHPVDPGGLRLQGRAAGRRLCRRVAGEPGQAVRPAPGRRQGRPLAGRGGAGDGQRGVAGRRPRQRRRALFPDPAARAGQCRGARRAWRGR